TNQFAVQLNAKLSPVPCVLLVEERSTSFGTLVPHVPRPLLVLRAMTRTGLATIDDPVNPVDVEIVQGSKSGFITDEPHHSRDVAKIISSMSDTHILN